jgi:hypothetical protein
MRGLVRFVSAQLKDLPAPVSTATVASRHPWQEETWNIRRAESGIYGKVGGIARGKSTS